MFNCLYVFVNNCMSPDPTDDSLKIIDKLHYRFHMHTNFQLMTLHNYYSKIVSNEF